MLSVLVDTVHKAERLVSEAALLVQHLKALSNGLDRNGSALPENVQQGQQQSSHTYHFGDTIWRHIHSNEREREGTRVCDEGLDGVSDLVETLCKLGRTVGCDPELERWENEGGR